MAEDNKAVKWIVKRDRLRVEQMQWMPLWRDCIAFCDPGKQRTIDNAYAQLNIPTRPRFNPIRQSSTAIDALNVLAGGCASWLIPGGDEGWGGMWQAEQGVENADEVNEWLSECTQRSLQPLQKGGYFTCGHEMFHGVGCLGTYGFFIEDGDDENPLYCKSVLPTNFVFERDWKGDVIIVQITYSKSATLIRDQFNQPGDKVPERITQDCESNNGDRVHELLQTIYLRTGAERAEKRDYEPDGQPYGSCWVHVDSREILRERGYPEMPFFAPRWLMWNGEGPSNYGTSPAMQAIADCKGLNLLDMVMAVRAELEINPRVLAGPSQVQPIDLSPGGITQVTEMNAVMMWANPGNYAIGKDQVDVLERRVSRAFFKDLFEAVTPIAQQREMNIPVADAVQREAAARISPAMRRLEQDFFQGAMMRVFMLLLRAGWFSPPPPGAIFTDRAGQSALIRPEVVQANRMTRTLNARKTFAFSQMMGRIQLQVAMGHPEVMDHYNFEAINSDLDRGDLMPKEWKYTEDQVAEMRAQRAQVAQQQQASQAILDGVSKDLVGVAQLAGLGPQQAA